VALDIEGEYEGGLENPVCQGRGGEGTADQCLLGQYKNQRLANGVSGTWDTGHGFRANQWVLVQRVAEL